MFKVIVWSGATPEGDVVGETDDVNEAARMAASCHHPDQAVRVFAPHLVGEGAAPLRLILRDRFEVTEKASPAFAALANLTHRLPGGSVLVDLGAFVSSGLFYTRGDPDFAGQVHCRPEDAGDVPQLGVADLWLQ